MKKIYLEFLRGFSSIFIMGCHLIFLAPTGYTKRYTAYWAADAVMMFFLLSGLVINLTESSRPKSTREFMLNRFIRIYPVLVVGLLLGILALMVTDTALPNAGTIIGNFFFLGTMKGPMGYAVPCLESNLPVWTLSFEFAFYILFAITIGQKQKRMIFYWVLLSLASIPLYFLKTDKDIISHIIAVFSFSAMWLVGYYIYEFRNYFYADKYVALMGLGIMPLISRMHFTDNFYDPFKYFVLSFFAVPFFRYALQIPDAGKKIKMMYLVIPHIIVVAIALSIRYMPLKNAIAYSILPYVYMGIAYLVYVLKLKNGVIGFIAKVGTITGKYSYSLYITHFPILFLFSKLTSNMWVYVFGSLATIAVVSFSLETWFQPIFVNIYKKLKDTKPAKKTTSQPRLSFSKRVTAKA